MVGVLGAAAEVVLTTKRSWRTLAVGVTDAVV
jgi:hypothetical protein